MDKPDDLNSPAPKLTSLEQAQTLVDALWPLRQEVLLLRAEVASLSGLREELASLKEQLGLSSRNSSLAPSQDRPGRGRNQQDDNKKKGKKRRGGGGGSSRSPGGQAGHQGNYREQVPLGH